MKIFATTVGVASLVLVSLLIMRTLDRRDLISNDAPPPVLEAISGGVSSQRRPETTEPAGDLGTQLRVGEQSIETSDVVKSDVQTRDLRVDESRGSFSVIPGVPSIQVPQQITCQIGIPDEPCRPVITGAQILAEESDDPDWARPMEGRIYTELAQFANSHQIEIPGLNVACREASCGILLSSPSGNIDLIVNPFTDLLYKELGFTMRSHMGRSESDSDGYIAIYFLKADR